MTYPRSPYDQSLANTMHLARLVDKVRQHLAGELPRDYAIVLGHKHGVDGQFLGHFGLVLEEVQQAVADKTDPELAQWISETVQDFPTKRDTWNVLAPNLGKPGQPMERSLKIALRRLYRDVEKPPEMSVFGLIDMDEERAS